MPYETKDAPNTPVEHKEISVSAAIQTYLLPPNDHAKKEMDEIIQQHWCGGRLEQSKDVGGTEPAPGVSS